MIQRKADRSQGLEPRQRDFDSGRGECDTDGQDEYHRRMAQGEEESHPQRLLPLLQHVAYGVVYRCDMVRIEGVAQPEHVGDEAQPDELGMAHRVMHVRSPPHHVQEADEAIE